MYIKAVFSRCIFEKNGFSVNLYRSRDAGRDFFKAKGKNLPCAKGVVYRLEGDWENSSGGRTFSVSSFEEVLPDDGEGIIRYLQSIDGIGKKTAMRLYSAFGDDIFNVFDRDMERILEVKDIRKSTYAKIRKCWTQKSSGKELFAYLYRFHVPENVIMRMFDIYEEFALHILRTDPYSMTDISGFGFATADAIARDNGLDMYSQQRIAAGVLEVIKEYESGGRFLAMHNRNTGESIQTGNTCIEWELLYGLTSELLDIRISCAHLARVISAMEGSSLHIEDNCCFFRKETAAKEMSIARSIKILANREFSSSEVSEEDLDEMLNLARLEGAVTATLSEEQKAAVLMSLNSGLSIITGGPGTGKTMIQKAIIHAARKRMPDADILLMAPTGRAARRMSDGAGLPASTIHSALGMYGDDSFGESELAADMIIVDEASMIDTHLACELLKAVPDRCQLVIVGDYRQLPSVGPGNVLCELIESGRVPVTRLTNVFRQKKGSSIGYNASRIINGNTDILEDDTFSFYEADSSEEISQIAADLYERCLAEYGPSEVVVLTPFRKETESGANQLNRLLQKRIIGEDAKPFNSGDKIMFTKNSRSLANGDIGFIRNISRKKEGTFFEATFEGKDIVLEEDDITSVELAYACTIHKSQGSEYKAVILVADPRHSIMLKRNLVYTAVTRAKEKLMVVGSKKAYVKAIESVNSSARNSRLASFLCRDSRSSGTENTEKQLSFDLSTCSE